MADHLDEVAHDRIARVLERGARLREIGRRHHERRERRPT
jgi:hypothetical protein